MNLSVTVMTDGRQRKRTAVVLMMSTRESKSNAVMFEENMTTVDMSLIELR